MFESEWVNKIVWREKVVRVLGGEVEKESKGRRGREVGKLEKHLRRGGRRGYRNVLKVIIGQVKKNCRN